MPRPRLQARFQPRKRSMKLKQIKYLIYALTGGCILMAALFGITNSIVFLWPSRAASRRDRARAASRESRMPRAFGSFMRFASLWEIVQPAAAAGAVFGVIPAQMPAAVGASLTGGCILMAALFGITNSIVFLWPTLAFAVALIGVNLAWWRCPHCGRHLGRDDPK